MDKFSLNKTFRSLVLNKGELEKLLSNVSQIVKDDNRGASYKKDASFKIEYKNGEEFETNENEKYLEFIFSRQNLKVSTLYIHYSGHKSNINLTYYGSSGPSISITSTERGNLLDNFDNIKNALTRENSWNWLVHFPSLLALMFLIPSVLLILSKLSGLGWGTLKNTWPFIWLIFMPLFFLAEAKYPLVVLKDSSYSSGRILKEDFLKILVTSIVMPLILNLLFKYI